MFSSQIADNSSDEEVAYPHAPPAPWMNGRRVLALIVGIAVSGTAVVAVVCGSSTKSIRAKSDRADAISQLSEEDPCDDKPQIKLSKVLHQNLGNNGPDTGDEGLVYEGVNIHPSFPEQQVLVVVNATAPEVIKTKDNGFHGKYGMIAVAGGTLVHTKFSFLDKNRKPIIIPELDITFFDLDSHSAGKEAEFVKIKKPDSHFHTKGSFVDISEGTDGYVTFKATVAGTGSDNPKDPLLLTTKQKHKAVTVRYLNTGSFEAELGSTTGGEGGWRGFLFVFRPSLLCAKTADGEEDPVIEEEKKPTTTTTTLPETTTTTVEEKKCWFTIPIINFCFPKLF
jgi:hypothetical protein